jgi:hypothetical protein
MIRRRLAVTIEADSMIEIDAKKWAEFLATHPATEKANNVKKQEKAVEELLLSEINRDDLAKLIGTEDGYDKFADTAIHVFVQEHCEKHDHWFYLSDSKPMCMHCHAEEAAAKNTKKEERERARS